MRHRRLITTALAAFAAMAITPAWAAASSFGDNATADFAAGTASGTWAVEPGDLRLKRTSLSANFDGASLPADLGFTEWGPGGTATVGGGSLIVDGGRVNPDTSFGPQTLEFRATFGGDAFQHVGFGDTFADGPWAMFSTGGASTNDGMDVGFYARTLATMLPGTPQHTAVSLDPQPHTYRIEWSATDVHFYVDDQPVTTPTDPIAGPMRPVVSDATVGGNAVKVEWLGMGPLPSTGSFESRVFDAGDARTVWGALHATVAGSDPVIKTRSGNTPTFDATWSDYQPLVNGAIQSPSARYIQYSTSLSAATPSLDKVTIDYDVDSTAPAAAIDGVQVSGTTATVSFSSPAPDVARFECNLDGGAFATCASPSALTGLAPGAHAVSVRAVDRFGNTGDAAASPFGIASPPQSGNSLPVAADKTAPKLSVVARSLRASKKGTVSFRVACPATETRCKVQLQLKDGKKIAAKKTVTVNGGQTVTVTLQLATAARQALAKRGSLKVSTVFTATDAAGNHKTTTRRMTLRRAAA